MTVTVRTKRLKLIINGVAATLSWGTFVSILGFNTLLPELETRRPIECTQGCAGIALIMIAG